MSVSAETLFALTATAAAALPTGTRQHENHVVFAETHIGILSIDDCVTQVYFHLVGAGRDVQNLRMILARRCLSGLQAIDEHERSHGGTGHDEFSLGRQLSFPRTEPTASG
jgi:hypothetical protein